MTDGLQLKNIEILRLGQVLLSLDLHIRPGTVGAVMGPSGAGKSTLLAAIAGQLPPEFTLSGEITLDGRSLRRLPAQARRVGILYQDHLLFPHMSVGANLAFGLDRLCTILGGETSIRNYIAFPKNNQGRDVMIASPSALTPEQLAELSIDTVAKADDAAAAEEATLSRRGSTSM